MLLGTGCLADAALDGTAILSALETLRLDRVLLVARPEARPRALAGVPAAAVRAAWDERALGVQAAAVSGARRLVLDLPADMELEAACRALFDLSRRQAGLALALMNPAEGPLASPEQLELILQDQAAQGLGYWHRPARAHRQGAGDVPWLDRLGRHLVGLSLDDVLADEIGLPPGSGELDLARTAELSTRHLEVALDTDPLPDVGLLRVALQNLSAAGFP